MSNDFIDISHWQNDAGTINFGKVKSAGILGVIAKCTEGVSGKDKFYQTNRTGALAAGLAFASYHFLRHGSAEQQMDWYLKLAQPVSGERVVIDYEDTACRIDDCERSVEHLRMVRPDLQITVYGASKLTDDARGSTVLQGTSLWAARYSSNQPNIATDVWPVWSAWQYTDKGSVPGISGNVDRNRFNGSDEACLSWFGPVGSVPTPEPEPEPGPEQELLVALPSPPEGYRWVVTVGGEEYEP